MKLFLSTVNGDVSGEMRARHRSKAGGCNKRQQAGFTLIELMVVVAIVGILTAIAYPAYTHYVIKTRRTAAKACLSEYANYMERFYTTNLTYDKAPDPGLDCESASQTGKYYGYTLAAGTPATSKYTLTATPTTAQPDTECGALSIDQAGTRTPAGSCW
ncbi:MAG TPA: type IV pilin protein [Rhodanobacter sp.]|nr:type IV pilin protein [Rhodanobacter sp.]